LLMPRASK